MKYFTIEELTRSTTATTRGIDNTPAEAVKKSLQYLTENLLDPIRARFGAPITINSGYRSPALNAAVGGAATSQHIKGEAVDITAGSRGSNRDLFELLLNSGLEFDQLIDESDYSWVHVSLKESGNRKQVLKL
ncbi:MAG: D-Ala-D-Ala carboxypeptidase family metallohydrolase [Rikenellaceae bacterium]